MSTVKLLFTLLSFCFTSIAISQPLNNSFENWSAGSPDEWSTSIQGVTQESVAYEGASSARLEVTDLGGFAYIPFLQSITSTFVGHPVSEKHGSLQGWYQFMPLGVDVILVGVAMWEGQSTLVGEGNIVLSGTTSGWTQFTVPITYVPGLPNPDNTQIIITVADTSAGGKVGTIGSMAYIDDLSFSGPSDVKMINGLPNDFKLSQNYPNPFNPTTNIEYSIPEQSYVELKVYDVLGNEVATLVNEEQSAGTYRADFNGNGLSSGLYIAQLTTGKFVQTIKMSLLK